MNTLILAAGRFGPAMKRAIEEGREPRLDVFEIAKVLGADVLDYLDVENSRAPAVRLVARALGPSPALAYLGYQARDRYDAILTTGEDIGLPLSSLLKTSRVRPAHTLIAHTLFPAKKRAFFHLLRVQDRIDRIFAYSTTEEQLMVGKLGIDSSKVQRIYYHADQQFFRPTDAAPEPNLLCAAGQLLRDYDCLIEAVRDLPVRLEVAAGSPWIENTLKPRQALPPNVSWGKKNRFELRALYARSALAVVPILQNEYQTGIATILEMMSMGKCVIATKTRGQTDTIVDGETGVYVPPSDPLALRKTIQRLLASPDEAARIGRAARRFVEENAGLDRFVERISAAVRESHAARLAA
ncbi:MAG TPA: glycosyltransferase family 4 protein [Polyangiaceae bacterium]|nr:glycosyltransferase family 4 protein [Polyangiaceae bacterium]